MVIFVNDKLKVFYFPDLQNAFQQDSCKQADVQIYIDLFIHLFLCVEKFAIPIISTSRQISEGWGQAGGNLVLK